MLKLAFRNITSRPWRFVATILAIAVVVAMSFSMLSFRSAVYDYIYATEIALSGRSDITISTNSSSNSITEISSSLKALDGVDEFVPVLKLYALLGDEYVSLRGFDPSQYQSLQDIELESGYVGTNGSDVIISKSASEHFNIECGDGITLKIGTRSITCYVSGIAKNSGYFLSDAPFQVIGGIEQFTKLVLGVSGKLCNEIYLVLKDGVSVEDTIATISGMEQYRNMYVTYSKNDAYVDERTESLTAPVVLAGIAVLLLGIAIIVLLYSMSEGEKRALISRLSVVGATKSQIFGIFLIESVLQAGIGAICGSVFAIGVFVGLLKITLSTTVTFSVSIWYLLAGGIIGFVSAIASSLLPINKAFRVSIRENQLDIQKQTGKRWILPICVILLTAVVLIVGAFVDEITGIFSLIGMLLALLGLGLSSTPALKSVATQSAKTSEPSVKSASLSMVREKRFARSSILLTTGMSIAMMLFMAWSLTTTIFTSYVMEFEHMILVTNIRADVNEDRFKDVEGVDNATKMVWTTAEMQIGDEQVTMNIFGSKTIAEMIDFEYITPKERVDELLLSDKPYVFVDISQFKLYGVKEGDTLTMTLGNETQQVIVGGILKHELFSGKYVVVSQEVLKKYFNADADTVLAVVNDNYQVDDVVGIMREEFASNNFYVVSALEFFRWDMESMMAVFDLIGALSIIVGLFICAVSITGSIIGRGTAQKGRVALLNAGMSKRQMLKAEMYEYGLIALIAFVLALACSLVITYALINALRLFGLYFEFIYEAWVTITAGLAIATCYTLTPLVFNFKKGYNLKRV